MFSFTKNKTIPTRGLTLVEVLVSTSIILVFFLALVTVYNTYLKLARANIDTVKAVFLAEEGIEVMKILRDSSWANKITPLVTGTNYYLVFNSGTWTTNTTNIFIDGTFERKINMHPVNRNTSTDEIVTSGGVDDPNTKLVTVTVSWSNRGATTSKAISTYITNLFGS